ncbi:hypothetical protein UT300005_09070 [Clostridium sp. CTA-5]
MLINARVQGEIVNKKEDVNIRFSVDQGITPYDSDIIISKYM